MNFWLKLSKPFFVLAPMADVTDWPFRQIVAMCNGRLGSPKQSEGGPDVFYTEFVSADGLCSEKGKIKLLPLLYFTEDERPIVAQIFGAKPEKIYKTAQLVRELGFDGLDINMGCPDRKILKQGAGIALCKTPELAKEIIAAAKAGLNFGHPMSEIPVSIKTRLGYSEIDMRWIETLLESDITALAVHLRIMKEMSKVPAHWEIAKEIAKLAHVKNTLFIPNGDVASREEGVRRAQETGCDGIMIGRGVFHNPKIFIYRHPMSIDERLGLLRRHVELFVDFWSRPPFSSEKMGRNFDVLKKFIKMYISNWDGASELRARLMTAKNASDISAILQ